MKLSLNHIAGAWFAVGAFIGASLTIFKLYGSGSEAFTIGLILFTTVLAAYYFGHQWGLLIIQLNANLKSLLKSIVYGAIVGVCTLFVVLFVITLFSYFQTEFLDLIRTGKYLQASLDLLKIPLLSLFGTIIGCLLEPIVLGLSSLGGLILYVVRHRILQWVNNERKNYINQK
jgi:hypothetical protein